MKSILIILCLCLNLSLFASEYDVCGTVYSFAENNCMKLICEQSGYTLDDCPEDGDFYVMLQECSYEKFNDTIDCYNKKTKSAKISCEEYSSEDFYDVNIDMGILKKLKSFKCK